MKLGKLLNKPEAVRYFTPDARLILPDCRIGVEFEFEGTGNVARERRLPVTPWSHYWEWHEEGSIREGGSEFAFIEPLFGRDAITAIEGLCNYANEHAWRATLRTGLHVHMDVRDLEVPQLVGFCVLYSIFEPVFYKWIGDNRENSHFCIPWYKAEGSILEAADIIRSASKPEAVNEHGISLPLLDSAERYNRYSGMNLQALFRFGSVEARQMKTTTDVDRILKWVNVLMALKRATLRVPQSDVAIVRMVENMGPRLALRELLGDQFEFLVYRGFEGDVIDIGIPTANELIRNGLTVNLWEHMNNPKGRHEGFYRFLEQQGGRRFEEPVVPLMEAPEVINVFHDEEDEEPEPWRDARAAIMQDPPQAAQQAQNEQAQMVWGGPGLGQAVAAPAQDIEARVLAEQQERIRRALDGFRMIRNNPVRRGPGRVNRRGDR
jgi:hypothetical protein